jgi:hypothetical protein
MLISGGITPSTGTATHWFDYYQTSTQNRANGKIKESNVVWSESLSLWSNTPFHVYNTADETTNYERVSFSRSSNVFNLFSIAWGSWVVRQMRVGSTNTYMQIDASATSPNYKASVVQVTSTTANGFQYINSAWFTASSGSQVWFRIANTVNQTGTAWFTDFLVNRTQTAVGSGTQALMDLQVNGSSKFIVTSAGNLGIGTATPSVSSVLELSSTSKWFLPPRMTTAQVNAIASPLNGLLVYNTDVHHLCGYQNGSWVKFNHSPM